MADLLSIGASGVKAYQTALAVTGDNIANVGTPDYTRRVVRLNEVAAGVGKVEGNTAGNGVLMSGIVRSTNDYATLAVRSAGADLARTASSVEWMGRIETALTGNNLGARVTSFFSSATALAAEPDSTALRQGMLSTAESAAIAFTVTGKALDQVASDIDVAGQQAASQLTAFGQALQQVNDGLGRTTPGTSAAAQLTDQRDAILANMSALVDVGVTTDTLGRATVTLGGSGGAVFVAKGESGMVRYNRSGGTVALSVITSGPAQILDPNGGALAGIVDGAQRVATARQGVNNIATDLVDKVNKQQALGDDRDGVKGTDLFAVSTAPGATPTDISVVPTDGAKIAAAGIGKGKRDASNLAALNTLRTGRGWEASLTAVVTDNATAYDQKKTIAAAQTAIRDGALTSLSSTTGVNLDNEAVQLMRFQQAYSACSRVIQVARDTLQSILDIR